MQLACNVQLMCSWCGTCLATLARMCNWMCLCCCGDTSELTFQRERSPRSFVQLCSDQTADQAALDRCAEQAPHNSAFGGKTPDQPPAEAAAAPAADPHMSRQMLLDFKARLLRNKEEDS